jgi:hypothetical protein
MYRNAYRCSVCRARARRLHPFLETRISAALMRRLNIALGPLVARRSSADGV